MIIYRRKPTEVITTPRVDSVVIKDNEIITTTIKAQGDWGRVISVTRKAMVVLALFLMALPAIADTAHPGDRDGYRYADNHAHGRYR